MVNFVLGDFKWHNRRRQMRGKGFGDTRDLGKAGMWVQHEKRGEPIVPIVKSAHQGERRRLSHPLHAVGLVDDMAPATMNKGQGFALHRITLECQNRRNCLFLDLGREDRHTVKFEALDGAFSDFRQQPLYEQVRARSLGPRHRPDPVQPRKNRHTFSPDDNIPTLINLRDPHAMFERKARQQVLQKTGVTDLACSGNCKFGILRLRNSREHYTQKKTEIFHSKPIAGITQPIAENILRSSQLETNP